VITGDVLVTEAGGSSPDELNQVMLPIIDREVCNQPSWYDGQIDDSMICAGYSQGGKDTCQVIYHDISRTAFRGVSIPLN